MALSSNSLIHFTRNKNSLIGILRDNFRIFYCLEHVYCKSGTFRGAVPMVSFCDIPLSEIKNHIDKYGCYGLGLKKSWAAKKGMNPVLYIEKESMIGHEFRNTAKKLLLGKYDNTISEEGLTIINLFRYMKNYEHELIRNDKIYPNYRFSDEREWRYVPPKEDAEIIVLEKLFSSQEQKNQANSRLENIRLEFTPDDITYIIINEETEIAEFIEVLRSAKGKNYTHQQVERLMTRIFTTEQIRTDI